MVLDSFSKAADSNVARGEMRFNFMVQGVTSLENIGVHDRIDTVVEVQMGAFAFPVPEEVPYVLAPYVAGSVSRLVLQQNNTNTSSPYSPQLLAAQYPAQVPAASTPFSPWVNNPYTQLPYGGRLTVQLREAGLQSYSDRHGARHHFEFTTTSFGIFGANPTMLLAAPISGGQWDTFVFTDPLKDIHGLTLVFRSPDAPIALLPDVFYEARVEFDASASPGPFVRIRAPGHALLQGDRIFLENASTGSATLDAYLNRAAGHVAAGDPSLPPLAPSTPIVLADPEVFYLDPAIGVVSLSLPIPNPHMPAVVTLFVAKRRLRIPLRMRRVVGRLTNYVTI